MKKLLWVVKSQRQRFVRVYTIKWHWQSKFERLKWITKDLLLPFAICSCRVAVSFCTLYRGGRWDFRFWPFFRSVFRCCCPLRFPVFWQKIKRFYRLWWPMWFSGSSNLQGRQRQTCTGSQCGFCGCVALSSTFKLHFCSYKHFF